MADRSVGDHAVEQLLKRELSRLPAGAASSECLDAEMLAAWAAGSIPAETSAGIEGHLASCDRCQAMLAVFVESEPPARVAASFWQRWAMPVLVPVAAASFAVFVWTSFDDRDGVPETTVARLEEPAGNAAAPVPGPAAQQAPSRAEAAPIAAMPRAPEPSAAVASETRAVGGGTFMVPSGREAADAAASSGAPRPAPASSAPVQNMPPTAPPAPAKAAAPAGPAASARVAAAAPRPDTPAAFAAAEGAGSAERARDIGGAGAAAPPVTFAPPAGDVRWRIAGGRLERSADAGSSWTAVPLASDVFVVAGVSPSADVCWVVGRAGQVLVSVNGQPFTRTSFDESADLVGVMASDALRATVQTADGRSFTTTDGGATWRER